MAYIGKTPTVGNFQVCDAISVVNGQAAYTLQVGGSNVEPESANHMLVSLNGILQKPGSSFTISGSTMTFASNLATGDVIDFVTLLGNVLDIGQPSDDTVTAAKLNDDIISGQTALTAEPDDTDEFLVSDAGTIKRIDYSLIKGGGITMADSWRITSNYTISSTGNSDLTSNWERTDSGGFGQIGTGLSESSGIFTFPSTGIYYIHAQAQFESGASLAYIGIRIQTTTNNSSYGNSSQNYNTTSTTGSNVGAGCAFIIDVTDTSTHKFKINIETAASVNVQGATDQLRTGFNVFRLGDT